MRAFVHGKFLRPCRQVLLGSGVGNLGVKIRFMPRLLWPRRLLRFVIWVFPLALIFALRAAVSWRPLQIAETGWVEHLAFSPDGKTLAVDSYASNGEGLRLRSVPDGELQWSSREGAFNYSGAENLLWAPHSLLLVAANHHLIAWDGKSEKPLFELSYLDELAASPDGTWIAAIGQKSQGSEIVVWNAARNRLQWRQVIDLDSVQTAFSSRYLCLGGTHLEGKGDRSHAELRVFNAADGRLLRCFDAPFFHINDMAFYPAQPNLLALTDNSGLSVMDVESGRRLFFFPFTSGHGALGSVEFSPDGSLLAAAESTSSGGPRSDVLLFDLKVSKSRTPELRHVRTLIGHSAWVTALAFSPDGNTLATGGFDRKLRLWRVR